MRYAKHAYRGVDDLRSVCISSCQMDVLDEKWASFAREDLLCLSSMGAAVSVLVFGCHAQ